MNALHAPVTVAFVDDHPDFREALASALANSACVELTAVCKDLPAGLRMLETVCPDVLLVDLGLPSGSGLALIREAQLRWGARCTSAVLTVTGNEDHVLTAVRAGAKGYLLKSAQPDEWCDTVCALAKGHSPLGAGLANTFLAEAICGALKSSRVPDAATDAAMRQTILQYLAAGYTLAELTAKTGIPTATAGLLIRGVYDQLFQPPPALSPRERELMGLLSKGCSYGQCADAMGIKESTIKTLATRSYKKLGALNVTEAVYEARATGLIA